MVILNRSFPRAEALAAEFPEVQAELRLMPELMSSIAESDVVFAASASEHVLIRGQDLADMPQAAEAVGGTRRYACALARFSRAPFCRHDDNQYASRGSMCVHAAGFLLLPCCSSIEREAAIRQVSGCWLHADRGAASSIACAAF